MLSNLAYPNQKAYWSFINLSNTYKHPLSDRHSGGKHHEGTETCKWVSDTGGGSTRHQGVCRVEGRVQALEGCILSVKDPGLNSTITSH